MTFNRFLLCAASCAFLLSMPRPASAQSSAAKDATDQAVLKRNEECNAAELRADIKNEDLASLADVSFFTASRFLQSWERKGAVHKSRGKVLIRCPEKLLA